MFKKLKTELEEMIENIEARIKTLFEGGQEEGVKHAHALTAAVNGLKIHVASGAETAKDLASHPALTPLPDSTPDVVIGTTDEGAPILAQHAATTEAPAVQSAGGVSAELSGADKLTPPQVAEGSVENAAPNNTTPPVVATPVLTLVPSDVPPSTPAPIADTSQETATPEELK